MSQSGLFALADLHGGQQGGGEPRASAWLKGAAPRCRRITFA